MGQAPPHQHAPATAVSATLARWLRFLAYGLVLLVALLALAAAVVRFWIFPRIDDFRPALERVASEQMGTPVRIGGLSAEWAGLTPRLQANDIRIQGPAGEPALQVSQAAAGLSWRSLIHWRPELAFLEASGVDVVVRRESDKVWWAAGRRLEVGRREGRLLDRPAMRWLLRQPSLQVHDASVQFRDDTGALPDITLASGEASLQHAAFGETRFLVQASPDGELGTQLRVQGRVQRDAVLSAEAWHGDLYAEVLDADLAAWQALGMWPRPALSGRTAVRTWLSVNQDGLGHWSGDVAVADFGMASTPVSARVPSAIFHVEGDGQQQTATATLAVDAGTLSLPAWFEAPDVPVQELAGEVRLAYAEATPAWRFTGLRGVIGEPGRQARFEVDGQWQRGGRGNQGLPGVIDLSGHVLHGDALAIPRFMPRQVGAGVRRWLQTGLLAGQVENATVVLRGDLADFPFDREPDQGEFRVQGHVADVALDVLPQQAGTWPPFEAIQGELEIDRSALSARVASAQVRDGLPAPVPIGPTTVAIPDMHAGAVLTVEGVAQGAARDFLAYVRRTPVADYSAGVLDAATATGDITVPLQVVVPLGRARDAKVRGEVQLAGNTIELHPLAPPFTQATGAITFTDATVGARDARATWLGGALRARGETALTGGGEISLNGTLQMAAVQRAWDLPLLDRLTGEATYTGSITGGAQGIELDVASDLRGLAVDLPAPLDKDAATAWPLVLHVGRGAESGTRRVDVSVAQTLFASAELAGGDDGLSPARLGVGVGAPARLPREGVDIAIRTGVVDVRQWLAFGESLSPAIEPAVDGPAATWATHQPLRAEWQAERIDALGQRLDDARIQVERDPAGDWRLQIAGRQAQGTLTVDPGTPAALHGRFARIALEPAPGASAAPARPTPAPADAEVAQTLPNLDLRVERFAYLGRELGSLVVAADNVGTNGHRWRVRQLSLTNDAATLNADGIWEPVNGGTRRRTTLDVSLEVRDAGALMDRLGFQGMVAGGTGHVKGSVGWAGAPFAYDVAGLDAHAGIALDHGRFLQTNNTAGRLLGILSLQSLARTATFSEGNLFASGFAWDTLRSEVEVKGGIARIQAFDLVGQSATAGLAGQADLVKETVDLRARILPQVDASGAAVLAGVAVNPVVGAGALLAQWLLRKPLSEALSMDYQVTGPWSSPDVQRVEP